MHRTSRPAVVTGVALIGAGVIAAAPVITPQPAVQHPSVRLVDVDHGYNPFPEVGWSDLYTNTTANLNGLTEMFNHTTAIYSLPEAVYTLGLTQVGNDLSHQLQQLAIYLAAAVAQSGQVDPTEPLPPFPNLFADPVLNPVSLLSLAAQNSLSSQYATNAGLAGLAGVYQNTIPSFNDISAQTSTIFTLLKDLFTGVPVPPGAFEAAFTHIGTDLTAIGNHLTDAPSTFLNDYLNGYPVESAAPDPLAGTIPSISDAYTLNAPFTATTNPSITPEFGLLTNPFAGFTTDSGGDGLSSSFLGTSPLDTGTLASLLQGEQTLSDELITVTAGVPGSGVAALPDTGPLTILGPDTLSFSLNLSTIPVIGSIVDTINNTVIPALQNTLIPLVNTVNDGIDTLSHVINTVVNPFIELADTFANIIGESIDPVNVNIPTIPLSDIPTIPTIPTLVGDTFNLPGIVESGVPAYVADITQNDMAILSSIAGFAAPVTGTVSSADMGNFLAENPIANLGTTFDSLMASIFGGTPLTFTAILPLDWTNALAESLNGLFTSS